MADPDARDDRTRRAPARDTPETLAAETTGPIRGARPPGPRTHIGRFRVQRVLGEGAFGCVFLATDTELGRAVAIKVPHAEALTPPLRERFLREARATATIHHPNVCPVYEVGTDGDVPYIVMHYVPGGTLATYLAVHKVMAPRPAVALAQKLALGVAAAHEKGVVHRDLKPANVLFDPAKMLAVITDFGLAMLVAETRMTADGKVNGTPLYMSPEQARGRTGEIGPPSDVYSLGVILFQLLTGEVPFTGTVFEVLAQHAEAPPRRPSQVRAGLDPRLDALVVKALAKKPGDRYLTAKTFAEALDDYQRGGPVVPPTPAAGASSRKPLPPPPAAPPAARSLPPRPPAVPPRPPVAPAPPRAAPPAAPVLRPARRAAPPPIPRRPTTTVLELPGDEPPAPAPRSRRRNWNLLMTAAALFLILVGLGVLALRKSRTADQRADVEAASAAGKTAGDVYVLKFGTPQQEMRFRWIPPGSFQMGGDVFYDEKPVHTVTISHGFWIAETETTQTQWKAVMSTNPSQVQGENLPVEFVSWSGAREFCRKLAIQSGKAVLLPTEAQWEYACRAGTLTSYYGGTNLEDLKRIGWCSENSDDQTHPVGLKEANAWGLRDMHGNVWEWCLDGKRQYNFGDQTDPCGPLDGTDPMIRGGSYRSHNRTASFRTSYQAGYTDREIGFRVCFRPE